MRIQGLFDPLLEVLIGLTFLVVLWVGGQQVLARRITLGSFVMFNTYMGMLVWPMIALGWVVNLMQRGTASLSRINEILAREAVDCRAARARAIWRLSRGEIEFRERLGRLSATARALDGVDLRIAAGATVAVVGHTGSGKSTLVSLMPRLIDPTEGSGAAGRRRPARARPRGVAAAHRLRSAGDVPVQRDHRRKHRLRRGDATRRADPPRGRDGGPGRAISRAFREGYRTMVGERGITLSGGQKQRTAIARALLRDPRILILDDALSSVDTLTEERILTHLAGVMRGRTVILISHRVSTVRQADRIVVLEKGRIVEAGHARGTGRGGRLLRGAFAEADAGRGAGAI